MGSEEEVSSVGEDTMSRKIGYRVSGVGEDAVGLNRNDPDTDPLAYASFALLFKIE